MNNDEAAQMRNFMSSGGAGWFVALIDELEGIRRRYGALISDELLAVDICTQNAWWDFRALSKAARIRWIRAARIELDHRETEHRIREIIEARECGDKALARLLLKSFPVDIALRLELTEAERAEWCRRAEHAARGQFDEPALNKASAKRFAAICGPKGELASGIYFATTDHQFVKIGFATNIIARLAGLQTALPRPLQLLLVIAGTLRDERELHRKFASLRVQGEWFRLTGELEAFIEEQRPKTSRGWLGWEPWLKIRVR